MRPLLPCSDLITISMSLHLSPHRKQDGKGQCFRQDDSCTLTLMHLEGLFLLCSVLR